jgi:toxin HigB-1
MRNVTRYTFYMIKSFRHKGLEQFFRKGSKAGIQPSHAEKLARQLEMLNRSSCPDDMDFPGWHLHALSGDLACHFSVRVSGNWRLTFMFEDKDAVLVDYQDYH